MNANAVLRGLCVQRLEMGSRQRMRAQQSTRQNGARLNREEEDEFADLTDPSGARKKLSVIQVRLFDHSTHIM
jgi:hypothetical protein